MTQSLLARRFLYVLALLACSGFASADTIINPTAVDNSRGESIWLNENGTPTNAYFAGVIEIALTQNGVVYNRDTMCVDVFTDISLNTKYDTQVLQPTQVSGEDLQRVSWLLRNVLLPTQGSYSSALPNADWVTTAAQGAGLQLAIWDMTTDGDSTTSGGGTGGLYSGKIQASSDRNHPTPSNVIQWAETYESLSANMKDNTSFVYKNWVIGQPSQAAQMLEGPMFYDGGPMPAPEPIPGVLVGMVLLGMLAHRRSKAR
jgi:hypothetical protein